MKAKEVERFVNECWTVQDLQRLFGVTKMTIHLWRKHRGLPAMVFQGAARNSVWFVPDEVRSWADSHGVRFVE